MIKQRPQTPNTKIPVASAKPADIRDSNSVNNVFAPMAINTKQNIRGTSSIWVLNSYVMREYDWQDSK